MAAEGNYNKALSQGVEVAASYYVSKFTGRALNTPSVGQNELASKAANAVASELNGRLVTDAAAPVIKQEIKSQNKTKTRTVN